MTFDPTGVKFEANSLKLNFHQMQGMVPPGAAVTIDFTALMFQMPVPSGTVGRKPPQQQTSSSPAGAGSLSAGSPISVVK